MPAGRPRTDLDLYKTEIIDLFNSKITYQDIVTQLLRDHSVRTSVRALKRQFQEWDVRKRTQSQDTEDLRLRILALFYQSLNDTDILQVLRAEGFQIQPRFLSRVRKDLGLSRRVSVFDREKADRDLLLLVQKHFNEGRIQTYGRGLLYTYFRAQKCNASIYARSFLLDKYSINLFLGIASLRLTNKSIQLE